MRRPALLVACALPVLVALAVGPGAVAADDGNVTVYRTADHVAADFENSSDVRDAIKNGTAEIPDRGDDNATELLVGDVAVFAVDSPRLAADVRAHDGNATAGFLAAREGNATFDVVHRNPGTSQPVTRFVLSHRNTRVLVDGDVTYVLVRTGSVELTVDGSSSTDETGRRTPRAGEIYGIDFGYGPDGSSGPPDRDPTGLEFVEPAVELPSDVGVLPTDAVTIEGWTTLPPTSQVTVQVSLPDDRRREDGRVENGSYAAAFDLSGVPNGTAFELTVRHDGATLASTTGEVRERRARVGDVSATLYRRSTDPPTYELWLSGDGYLSHGGAIRVRHDGETLAHRVVPDGRVNWSVGVSGWDPATTSVAVEAVGPSGERYARGDAHTVIRSDAFATPTPATATATPAGTTERDPEAQRVPGGIATLFALLALASRRARR